MHGFTSHTELRLIAIIARFFGIGRSDKPKKSRKTPSISQLIAIRQALLDCVLDCEGTATQRLRRKIDRAETPQELWQLRNDAYQVISQQHNQAVAAERINALIGRFRGWVDAKQLVRIK